MTIKELKEKISDLPDRMEVFMAERTTDFAYGLVNSAYVKVLDFSEAPDEKVLAQDSVLVLDED
jgi:hypothetical protein